MIVVKNRRHTRKGEKGRYKTKKKTQTEVHFWGHGEGGGVPAPDTVTWHAAYRDGRLATHGPVSGGLGQEVDLPQHVAGSHVVHHRVAERSGRQAFHLQTTTTTTTTTTTYTAATTVPSVGSVVFKKKKVILFYFILLIFSIY